MSVPQYLRKVSLKIGNDDQALDLSDLHFRFVIRRGDIQTPNTADIIVYNVSDSTAQAVQKEYTRVVLQAGYDGSFGVIFDGTIKQVRRGRESPTDTYLAITAADGDSAYVFAFMNESIAAGSTAQDRLDSMMKVMGPHGVTLGYTPELPNNRLPRGRVFFGPVRSFLSNLAKRHEAKWSIQNGKVQICPLNSYVPGAPVIVTSATGMVGLPEETINGLNVKMLLNPNVKIGTLIQIDNASIQQYRFGMGINDRISNDNVQLMRNKRNDGYYYVMIAEHYGDTRGNDWYTTTKCLAVDSTFIPEGYLANSVVPDEGVIKKY
ncbi:phage protein [Chitiniphilus shinanonensis]|uniref:phage protein n=1 Tax=Chitiniphilus shinanonensis TaxID=553088 RepID=UPI00304CA699